jgi:serine/threonine protein kinase
MLGHYQLLAVVGAGGMGRVWAARQVGALQRLVAIKTALCDAGQTKEFERVFIDEARIASLIHHPHVCGVYELGEEKGVLFLVMEWSDGGTLLEVVSTQPEARLSTAIGASIVAKICAGLHAAHELEDELGEALNVVHRDVTPQNILLSSRGHVRLADFGVAKAQGQLHRPTETGEVKGKLSYMAPEQLTSRNLDRRVDIFALGCVLYECTVGRRPFQGDGALSTLYQILEEEVTSPSSLLPGYPVGLERIVLKALEKDPAARYQTAEAMQKDLESWLIVTGAEIGEADFSQLVNSALGDSIRKRNEAIEEAIERLDHPERFTKEPAIDLQARQSPGESSTPGVSSEQRSRTALRSSWFVPAIGGLATLTAVAVFAAGRLSEPSARTANSGVPALSAPPAPRPERVRVTVKADPEFATVQIDDAVAVDAPFSAEVVADGLPHNIVVAAKGYEPKRLSVVFDTARDVFVRLQALPEVASTSPVVEPVPGPSASHSKIRTGKPTGGATPAVLPTKSSGDQSGTGPSPETDKRNKRILDTTNPFGD